MKKWVLVMLTTESDSHKKTVQTTLFDSFEEADNYLSWYYLGRCEYPYDADGNEIVWGKTWKNYGYARITYSNDEIDEFFVNAPSEPLDGYTKKGESNMKNTERNEKVATEIRNWMLDNEIWIDTRIYFNGKAYGTSKDGEFYYNDRNHLVVLEDINPLDYFEYVNPETISMSFEGPLYDILNYSGGQLEREFSKILEKYGLYYELGNAWNLTCGEL